ncbi:MAG: hypothetical protein JNJ69_14540 [Leptospiraceae bacterium]|nr:hypothetical protein [Leptospiraceae bacterium]
MRKLLTLTFATALSIACAKSAGSLGDAAYTVEGTLSDANSIALANAELTIDTPLVNPSSNVRAGLVQSKVRTSSAGKYSINVNAGKTTVAVATSSGTNLGSFSFTTASTGVSDLAYSNGAQFTTTTPTVTSSSSGSASAIYLFGTSSSATGAGATGGAALALCNSAKTTLGVSGSTVGVFYSTAAQNISSVSGIPASAPVKGPNGTTIASNWAALFTGTILATLDAAGVFTTTQTYWTGSTSAGAAHTNHCDSFTNQSAGAAAINQGMQGRSDATGSTWIAESVVGCYLTRRYLCYAY